ncbi:MAG TPA: efflux RND transporter periplasmic adaptor subunit [Terriglobales bacterium]|jgi:HlyD family secretion protein
MKKRAAIMVAIAAVAAVGWWWSTRPRAETLMLTGTVDGNEIVVGAQITGRITHLDVQDGQAVHAGQLIATLDQGVQQADAQAAAAAIQQANANARQSEAQSGLLAATLPAKVAQAEAQQAQAQAQLAQAQAQVQQTQAAWDKANANYTRTAPLAAKGVASELDLDNAKADLDGAAANRRAAQAGVEAAQRAISAATAAVRDAQAQQRQIAVQQQQTASLDAAARGAQASHQAAVVRLDQTQILAPVDGIITLRAAREGEVVSPGSPIVTIFDLSDTWVDADVEETYAPLIRMGQTMQVQLPTGQTVTGPVIYKAVEADFATQRDVSRTKRDIKTIALRVKVANPQGALPLGMTAWIKLPVPADMAAAPLPAGPAAQATSFTSKAGRE